MNPYNKYDILNDFWNGSSFIHVFVSKPIKISKIGGGGNNK